MNKGTCAEVDYVIARSGSIVPIEVKSGVKGSMSSMYSLMRNPQKHIEMGIRCSLENLVHSRVLMAKDRHHSSLCYLQFICGEVDGDI